jgi:hypothetical protein
MHRHGMLCRRSDCGFVAHPRGKAVDPHLKVRAVCGDKGREASERMLRAAQLRGGATIG